MIPPLPPMPRPPPPMPPSPPMPPPSAYIVALEFPGTSPNFRYSSPLWTNTALHNLAVSGGTERKTSAFFTATSMVKLEMDSTPGTRLSFSTCNVNDAQSGGRVRIELRNSAGAVTDSTTMGVPGRGGSSDGARQTQLPIRHTRSGCGGQVAMGGHPNPVT